MLRLFARRRSPKNESPVAVTAAVEAQPRAAKQRSASVEELESRTFFTAAPYITSILADNRGEVIFNTNRSLNPSTVNTASVFLFNVGPDGEPLTADDTKMPIRPIYTESNRQLRIRTIGLPADTTYFVKLSAKLIKSWDGMNLDGEFNGAGVRTGNGNAWGDTLFISRRDKGTRPVARFSTRYGAMNVSMFKDLTPGTYENFRHYANEAAWDGTFIHRSIKGFVSQGGGFTLTQNNGLAPIHQEAPVANEFIAGTTTNIRGRIAMAKLPDTAPGGGPDSATNQWFFNAADNRSNLDNQNGGFTAFGEINSADGLATLDLIQNLQTLDGVPLPGLGSFDDVPLHDAQAAIDRGVIDPGADLVEIRRVAILNKIGALVVP